MIVLQKTRMETMVQGKSNIKIKMMALETCRKEIVCDRNKNEKDF